MEMGDERPAPRPAIPRPTVVLARGMIRRCAVCGRGGLFRRWFAMADRCPRCGLRFETSEGAFLGAMSVNYAVAGLAFIAFLAVTIAVTLPDPPVFLLTAGSLGVIVAVIAVFWPFSKTIWVAIEVLLHDPADLDFGPPGRDGHRARDA